MSQSGLDQMYAGYTAKEDCQNYVPGSTSFCPEKDDGSLDETRDCHVQTVGVNSIVLSVNVALAVAHDGGNSMGAPF